MKNRKKLNFFFKTEFVSVWNLYSSTVVIVYINTTKTTFNFNFEVYQALNSKITYINREKWSINSFSLFTCKLVI